MASQGPNSPGTMANTAGTGFNDWINVDNAKVSDNIYATCEGDPLETKYLKATNFGFTIPSGATINGIKAEIECININLNTYSLFAKIVKSDGSLGTSVISFLDVEPINPERYEVFGGDTELWGETWTDVDINDADFGVVFYVTCGGMNTESVDHIRITVYYTEVATGYSHKVSGVAPAAISKVIGVATASIQSVANIDT